MKKILLSSILLSTFLIGANIALADENNGSDFVNDESSLLEITDDSLILNKKDFSSEEELNNKISYYLESGEFKTINVIEETEGLEENLPNINSRASYIQAPNGEKLVFSGINNSTGSVLNQVSGQTNMTINLSYSKTVSRSLSGQGGIKNSFISAQVGYSVTGSDKVSFSGTYKVPKNVKRATITGRTLYRNHNYNVYKNGRYNRSLQVKRPTGISYSYTLTK